MHEKIKSFPDISFANRKNKKGILLAKGWTLEETKRYILYVGDSNRLGFYVERYVNELVMYRYAYINQKFDLNKVGKEIVYNIISSILNEYVQSILKYFKGLKLSYFLQYLNMYYDVEKQIERYNNRFIAPEISKFKGLIDTLLKTKFTESDATASHTAVKEELKNTESS